MTRIELIRLTLDEIRRSADMIASVQREAELRLQLKPNLTKDDKDVLETMVESQKTSLNNCFINLREVLEDIAQHQNNSDMLTGVDVALTKVPYDLIYERKTDKDFEEE